MGPTSPGDPVAGGNWHVWHAPDGLRAIAATALGCVQAGAEKLGVMQARYASAIIDVERRLALDKPVVLVPGKALPGT